MISIFIIFILTLIILKISYNLLIYIFLDKINIPDLKKIIGIGLVLCFILSSLLYNFIQKDYNLENFDNKKVINSNIKLDILNNKKGREREKKETKKGYINKLNNDISKLNKKISNFSKEEKIKSFNYIKNYKEKIEAYKKLENTKNKNIKSLNIKNFDKLENKYNKMYYIFVGISEELIKYSVSFVFLIVSFIYFKYYKINIDKNSIYNFIILALSIGVLSFALLELIVYIGSFNFTPIRLVVIGIHLGFVLGVFALINGYIKTIISYYINNTTKMLSLIIILLVGLFFISSFIHFYYNFLLENGYQIVFLVILMFSFFSLSYLNHTMIINNIE